MVKESGVHCDSLHSRSLGSIQANLSVLHHTAVAGGHTQLLCSQVVNCRVWLLLGHDVSSLAANFRDSIALN